MSGQPAAAKALDLEARGRLRDAMDEWSALNREHPDTEIEQRLVRLRHEAVHTIDAISAPGLSTSHIDPFRELLDRPPSIAAHELSGELIHGAIAHHGCLLVRQLMDPSRADALRVAIDATFDAREASLAGAPPSSTAPWFVPDPRYDAADPKSVVQRTLNRNLNSVLAVDSPRSLFLLIDALEDVGIPRVLAEYFAEPVFLSVEKSTLRRVRPGPGPAWHQDGSFLGTGVRALDIWVALSRCGDGTDAAGLEILPRRMTGILEHGSGTARTEIEVVSEEVERAAKGARPVRPTFEAGDALLFDDLFLHRTMPGRERTRYALELWSFGASAFPDGYVPFVL
jgi:phytanoyl-CoA dioxygenase PhyH